MIKKKIVANLSIYDFIHSKLFLDKFMPSIVSFVTIADYIGIHLCYKTIRKAFPKSIV